MKNLTCISLIIIAMSWMAVWDALAQDLTPPTNPKVVQRAKRYDNGRLKIVMNGYSYHGKPVYHGTYQTFYNAPKRQTYYAVEYVHGKKQGKYREYFPNGVTKEEGLFAADQKTDEWTTYREDGTRKATVIWKDGKKNGPSKVYYRDGSTYLSGTYDDDLQTGLWQRFNPDKTPHSAFTYLKGKKHGPVRKYGENGQLLAEVNYQHDLRDGTSKTWLPDGTLIKETNFKAGKPDGPAIVWYPNGQKKMQFTMNQGKKDGQSSSWFEDGKPESIMTYTSGTLTGKAKLYHQQGYILIDGVYRDGEPYEGLFYLLAGIDDYYWMDQWDGGRMVSTRLFNEGQPHSGSVTEYYGADFVKRSFSVKDGIKNGSEIWYYPDTRLMRLLTWKDGKLHGPMEEYFEDGRPFLKVNMANDVKDGREVRYDRRGNIIADGTWRSGKPWDGVVMVEETITNQYAFARKEGKALIKMSTKIYTEDDEGNKVLKEGGEEETIMVLKKYENGIISKDFTAQPVQMADAPRMPQAANPVSGTSTTIPVGRPVPGDSFETTPDIELREDPDAAN